MELLGNLIGVHQGANTLRLPQALIGPVTQALFRDIFPAFADNDCQGRFAPFRAGDGDYRHLMYRRVLQQYQFEVGGIEIETT